MHEYVFSAFDELVENRERKFFKEDSEPQFKRLDREEKCRSGQGRSYTVDSSQKGLDTFASLIQDNRVPAQEKLQAVEQLAKSGITSLVFEEANGQKRNMRLELEVIGNRALVHLFATDDSGRERIVLRGVKNGKGGFDRQKNSRGKSVDYHGDWWSANMQGRTTLALPEQAIRPDSHRTDEDRDEIQETIDRFFYYLPEVELSDTPERPSRPEESDSHSPESAMDQRKLNDWFDRLADRTGRARRLTRTGTDAVYFRAGMAIDADGSPRARQIDPYGSPNTSLRYKDGRSVNAETENYIVLPMHKYAHLGIKKGDIAAVRHNGRVVFAVFADVGPSRKLGEGSMALASALGINNNPIRGGTHKPVVEYIVFPGSGDGTPGTNQGNALIGALHLEKAAARIS